MEIKVTLHTSEGDVVSSYPSKQMDGVIELINQYTKDGKSFSVETVK